MRMDPWRVRSSEIKDAIDNLRLADLIACYMAFGEDFIQAPESLGTRIEEMEDHQVLALSLYPGDLQRICTLFGGELQILLAYTSL